ncbi:MAG: hypothetical protein ABFD49_07260 [Armatimonadota bacterium]|nr:hypothetical protein [bacterium]
MVQYGGSKCLDAVDDIIGNSNLLITLDHLTRWGLYVDPIISASMPFNVRQWDVNTVKGAVHPWTIAYFAMVCLNRSNVHRRGELKPNRFIRAVNNYNAYSGPIDDLRSVLVRIAFQQFVYQRQWWTGMSRSRYMFGESGGEYCRELAALVADTFGATIDEILRVCLSIYFTLHSKAKHKKECHFSLDELTSGFLQWLDSEVVRQVVSRLSQSQQEFREKSANCQQPNRSLRLFDLNPLLSKPLVRIEDSYYAPLPMLVPLWGTSGIVYELLDQATKKGIEGRFGDVLGHAFEDFVADLLSTHGVSHTREVSMPTAHGEVRSADFIVVDKQSALILDCKSRRIRRQHRSGLAEDAYPDYKEAIIKGVQQCLRTERWIRAGRPELLCKDSSLSNLENFTHAVVTMDDFHMANCPLIWKELNSEIVESVAYQVMSSHELEMILNYLPSGSIVSTISENATSPELRPASYRNYLFSLQDEQSKKAYKDPSRDFVLSVLCDLRSTLDGSA